MKDATGELNMTVITIVAIAAIAALFTVFVMPALKKSIGRSQCKAECGDNFNYNEVNGEMICNCS